MMPEVSLNTLDDSTNQLTLDAGFGIDTTPGGYWVFVNRGGHWNSLIRGYWGVGAHSQVIISNGGVEGFKIWWRWLRNEFR